MDLAQAMAPKSDQLNSDDLITRPLTATIKNVRIVGGEQPVVIDLDEFPRPWKPSKSMLRVLADRQVWGPNEAEWTGKRLTLFREPEVTFGRDKVGGIRISHVSGIAKRTTVVITKSRGQKMPFVVEPLAESAPTSAPVSEETVAQIAELRAEWKDADADRRKVIEAEVERLQNTDEPTP